MEPKQIERVHCFDEQTGNNLWTHDYDCAYSGVGYEAGPRASVSIDEGRAYALGSMGHLHCFDAKTGDVLWKHDCNAEYQIRMPIWGIAASPLIEKDLVIVQIGGTNACLVAFDKQTGKEVWTAPWTIAPRYSAPIIIEQAGQRVLVCWTGDSVAGLDPATGKRALAASVPAQQDGDQHCHAGAGEGPAVSHVVLRRLADARACTPDKLAVEQSGGGRGRTRRTPTRCTRSSPRRIWRAITSTASTATASCAAWTPRRATACGRAWKPRPRPAGATSTWSSNGERMFMFNERGELIIAKLSPQGYQEISRAKLIEPTTDQLRAARRRLLGASGLRQQARLHPQRQGAALREPGEVREGDAGCRDPVSCILLRA